MLTGATMARTVKKPDVRRVEFLKAAQKLFSEKGFYDTSIEDISHEVGVAKGLFYHYFPSKDELMKQMVNSIWDESEGELWDIVNAEGLDAIKKLFVFSAQRRQAKVQGLYFLEVLKKDPNSPLIAHLRTVAYARLIPMLARIIEQGVKEGHFDTPYPEAAAEFLLRGAEVGWFEGLDDKDAYIRMIEVQLDMWERVTGAEKGTFSRMIEEGQDIFDKVIEKVRELDEKEARANGENG
jgi:AcrR family transcriptional regulator